MHLAQVLLLSYIGMALPLMCFGGKTDAIVAIAPHPTKPNILYVATDESVDKSRDGGKT